MLKDLLFPESSPLYNTDKFRASKAEKGNFKKYFFEAFAKGNYPNLKAAMGLNNNTRDMVNGSGVDSTNEIWTNENGVSIYFPYSENFPGVNPNDPNNNTPEGNLVTIVSATETDTDSGSGWEPYYYVNPDPTGFQCMDNICYNQVTVDDDYAELHPTHIVGVGAEPQRTMSPPPQPTPNQLVFIGEVMCTEQLDHLISIHNGGGPNLRFVRGDAYLNVVNGQVTNPQTIVPADLKRKDVRKKRWKTVNMIWDANWESDNQEQVFAIYEEDTEGDKTISGSLQTTSTYPASGGNPSYTAVGTQNYSFTIHSKNPIIRQLNWDRTGFFGYNRGNLNNGCGSRNGWTIYDCSNSVRYTMTQQ